MQMEQMREDQCNRINDLERQRCADQIYDRKGRDPEWHECGSVTSCSADEERCESMYRSCYQGCGGEVRAETRCVANCEQIPPGQR